jgi:hypothetical protein
MSERSAVRWEDISREAESIFRIWADSREVEWAKKSWEALGKRGLTSYSNQIERTRVLVRLISLAAIYMDFCELAFDEAHNHEYVSWAEELSVSSFRVAQCVGSEFEQDREAGEEELLEGALLELMAVARSEIHEALRSEWGDDSLLFVSLWNTVEYQRNELASTWAENAANLVPEKGGQSAPSVQGGEIDWLEDAGYILNSETTWQKLAAFSWIEQGMQSVH